MCKFCEVLTTNLRQHLFSRKHGSEPEFILIKSKPKGSEMKAISSIIVRLLPQRKELSFLSVHHLNLWIQGILFHVSIALAFSWSPSVGGTRMHVHLSQQTGREETIQKQVKYWKMNTHWILYCLWIKLHRNLFLAWIKMFNNNNNKEYLGRLIWSKKIPKRLQYHHRKNKYK